MEIKVRIERIKTISSYDKAFDHLTNFYKRRKISHDLNDEVVDLTGDDAASEGEVDGAMDDLEGESGEQDGDDTIQRASGVQCMSECSKTWSS
jgi:hypothetical protein